MSLFAIADLHLSLSSDKPMDVFPGWDDYVAKLENNWRLVVKNEDTVVLPGDISWAMSLSETAADFAFISELTGRKIILKGNHDYWWTTLRKMNEFLRASGFDSISFVHNSACAVGGIAVCGTRGWFYDTGSDKKVLLREAGRLESSIKEAEKTGLEPVVFLHYPPIYGDFVCDEIMEVLVRHKIRRCYYGHLHGRAAAYAVQGEREGIRFRLVSADHLKFLPEIID